jgi:hypothetical protein
MNTQSRIDEALDVLIRLGFPRGQQNQRTALTLLALCRVSPTVDWHDMERPILGITPIMDWIRIEYEHLYAPNSRETIRKQSVQQLVQAGIVVKNPDVPARPVNSPLTVYQLSAEAAEVIRCYQSDQWPDRLAQFLAIQPSLLQQYAKERKSQTIPVDVSSLIKIELSPGVHSQLIRDIIERFMPCFTPGAELLYVGDTGQKWGFFNSALLSSLQVEVNDHGKMPDVVFYWRERNWLVLAEAVTSHGAIDGKRHSDLQQLFGGATAGLVYVTAFPNRETMRRFLSDIAWESEVWVADAPTHLIHFNGEKFLGPY